jgi:hypothetical protein
MELANTEDAIQSISESARARRLAIFCGAGVSMLPPSKSPSWWEIYAAAATALRDRLREGFPEVTADVNVDELLKPLQTQQLADLVGLANRRGSGCLVLPRRYPALWNLVDQSSASWNRTAHWLRSITALRQVA